MLEKNIVASQNDTYQKLTHTYKIPQIPTYSSEIDMNATDFRGVRNHKIFWLTIFAELVFSAVYENRSEIG